MYTHTHIYACTHATAQRQAHARTLAHQSRGGALSGELLHFLCVIYTPHCAVHNLVPRLDFFHVVLCANEIKSVPIGTGLMEMINFY